MVRLYKRSAFAAHLLYIHSNTIAYAQRQHFDTILKWPQTANEW